MYATVMGGVRRLLDRPDRLAEERLPWTVFQSWQDLLFMHWKVPTEVARSVVPASMELDLYEGQAWISLVPMHMVDVRIRGLPRQTAISWPEVNFRTYVRRGDQTGIVFLSIDASSRLGAWSGRKWNLPLLYADVGIQSALYGWCELSSQRPQTGRFGPAHLDIRYRGVGPVRHAQPGTLEYFLTERELMFMEGSRGTVYRGRIWHDPWPLQDAEVEILHNTVPASVGLQLGEPDWMIFSPRADTLAWLPMPQPGTAE